MKLAERRVLEDFEKVEFPKFLAQIQETAGFNVPVEVDWPTLITEDESHLFSESWSKVYFEPLVAALRTVARDDMGRAALKDGLKKIIIRNTKKCYYGDKWAELNGGELILDHEPTTNAGDVDARRDGLVKVLENSL